VSRILLATWDGGGCVPSMLHLALRLQRAGHQPLVASWTAMAGQFQAAGMGFSPMTSVSPWPAGMALEQDWDLLDDKLHGPQAEHILAAADALGPDVVVVDCMMGAAFRVAAQLGVPYAVLVHLLYQHFFGQIDDVTPGCRGLLTAADLVLALTPPGFDSDGDLPANTMYVGSIGHSGPAPPLHTWSVDLLTQPGPPWVLLSLSTTVQDRTIALPPLLEALGMLPVRVLLTLGGALPAHAVAAPANVTVRGNVPHAAVLAHMALVVCHGGLSTITAALTAGKPVVAVPQGRDQNLNAARVHAAGVGLAVNKNASPAEIASAVTQVLHHPAMGASARRYAGTIAGLGPGALAISRQADTLVR
jgi:UDP:flavonoid glycosyltransferase YjiC (YdhE family)